MREGHRVKFPDEASCSNLHVTPGKRFGSFWSILFCLGDVIVTVNTVEHTRFVRKNADLLITQRIGLAESLCGVDFNVKHLDGRQLRIQSNPGEIIRSGQVKCIESEGMPVHGQPQLRGNLYIRFEVDYPDRISPRQQTALRSIFGGHSRHDVNGDLTLPRDVKDLKKELDERERFGRNNSTAYDSDDSEDGHPRNGHVQCAHQ